MGVEQSSCFCETCQRSVLASRPTANHVLHLLLAVLSCGFWIPIWVLCAIDPGPWRCQLCGRTTRKKWTALEIIVVGAAVVATIGIASSVSDLRSSSSSGSTSAPPPGARRESERSAARTEERSSHTGPAPAATPTHAAATWSGQLAAGPSRSVFIRRDHGRDVDGSTAYIMPPGSRVDVLEQDGGQLCVRFTSGREGWIAAEAVTRDVAAESDAAPPPPEPTIMEPPTSGEFPWRGRLSLASDAGSPATYFIWTLEDHAPTESGDRSRSVRAGTFLTVLEERDGQYRVSLHGEQGWIETQFVERE